MNNARRRLKLALTLTKIILRCGQMTFYLIIFTTVTIFVDQIKLQWENTGTYTIVIQIVVDLRYQLFMNTNIAKQPNATKYVKILHVLPWLIVTTLVSDLAPIARLGLPNKKPCTLKML